MSRQSFLAGILVASLTLLGFLPQASGLEVELNGLRIEINDVNGCITRLSHPATGEILRAAPDVGGLLDVAYPVPAFAPMRLASRFSQARIEQGDKQVRIIWEKLGPSRGNFPLPEGNVHAEVTLQAAPDGRSVIVQCRIDNQSKSVVPQVMFPDLWGLRPMEAPERTRLRLARGLVNPFTQPFKDTPDATPFYLGRGWQDYPQSGYLAFNALRWLDYGGFSSGLSIFHKKWATPDYPGIRTQRREADPDSLRLLWENRQRIEPGTQWDSGEFWLTPHAGGWAKGIEVYRDYVKQVNQVLTLPRHVREGIGFQTAWLMQTTEMDPAKADFLFKDIPRIASSAKEYGLDELVIWGQCVYSTMPIPLRSELGSREEFLDGVRQAKDMGVNVAPFVSIQIVRNRYADRYGAKPGVDDWTYHQELIPSFRPYYTDFWNGVQIPPQNEIWQQDVKASLGEWIDAGVPSFSWDVFATDAPEGQQPPLIDLIHGIREKAKQANPESTFSGESMSLEFIGRVLDYTWNWVDYMDVGPILNVIQNPRINCNVEDSPRVVKLGFCDNLYLNVIPRKPDSPNGTALVSDRPALATALKEVVPLRQKFLPYFTDGVNLGDSVLREPAGVHVTAYQRPNSVLIIVLNDTKEVKTPKLAVELSQWMPAASSYLITQYNSRGETVNHWEKASRGVLPAQALQPLELVVYQVDLPSTAHP